MICPATAESFEAGRGRVSIQMAADEGKDVEEQKNQQTEEGIMEEAEKDVHGSARCAPTRKAQFHTAEENDVAVSQRQAAARRQIAAIDARAVFT